MQYWSGGSTPWRHCGQLDPELASWVDCHGLDTGGGYPLAGRSGGGPGGLAIVGTGGGSAARNSSADANRLSSRAYERRKALSSGFGTAGFRSLGTSVPAGRSPVSSS